ncbi:MAG: magnesium transporter [Thermoguttaceae bacterium]|nr:magnesium transporter [Thermoguttaceae bacterium]MDW8038112.1 magnesium transporter [Thermoguttaceae bacterium]
MKARSFQDRLNDPVLRYVHQDYPRILCTDTVAEALHRVQHSQITSRIVYFYVVDAEDRLCGVLPTRQLLLRAPHTPVAELMIRKVISLPQTATLLEALELFMFHRLLAFPVVDEKGRILGIIDVDLFTKELTDLAQVEESDDIFQILGVHLRELREANLLGAFIGRLPWLLCNIGGGLACAMLGALFQQTLDRMVVLALFIPVVLALAESVSMQSLSLTLPVHEPWRMSWPKWFGLLRQEGMVGAMLGTTSGAIVAAVAWAWQWSGRLALTLLASIGLSVAWAAMLGLSMPIALRALQRDPKVASGPVSLALVDVTTLVLYLALASWFFT